MTRATRQSSLFLTLSFAIGVLLALTWFRYAPAPFVGPLVIAAALGLLCIRIVTGQAGQSVLVTLATITLTLAGAEAYWWHRMNSGPPTLSYPENYLAPDPVVGYAPVKRAAIRMRRVFHDTLLYDVGYTIDSTGLRVSPPPAVPPPSECVLFFGDSYTFGEGVADSEAMPYRVAVRTGGRYHILNFGLHGYGPHQMLALLESGRVKRVLDCTPRYAIYLAIPDHVARAADRRPGGRGPRYALETDGLLKRQPTNIGDDGDGVLTVADYIQSQVAKSALVTMMRSRVRTRDWKLFFAIVEQSARVVRLSFPKCDFEVIVWAAGPDTRLADGLRRRGLRVHELADVLPSYHDNPKAFSIPIDGHPNASAQDQVAAYVVTNILHLGQSRPVFPSKPDLRLENPKAPTTISP